MDRALGGLASFPRRVEFEVLGLIPVDDPLPRFNELFLEVVFVFVLVRLALDL